MGRLILIVLLISVFLVSCQTEVAKDPFTELVDASSGFSPDDVSNKLIRRLTAEQVNLLGEIHEIKEIKQFYRDMIPEIHQEGIRMIALEIPVTASLFFDMYVRGELPADSWRGDEHSMLDHVLVEVVRDFNQDLRDVGKADEQIRLLTYDVDWAWSEGYTFLIKYLKQAGLASSFYQYYDRNVDMIDGGEKTGLTPEQEAEFYWISQRTKVNFDNFKFNSPLDILRGGYGKETAEFREGFMTENLLHHINQLEGDDKILVIAGSAHVTKLAQATNFLPSVLPMAVRLESSLPGYVNTTSFVLHRLLLPELNGVQNEIEQSYLMGDQDLFRKLSEVHEDKWAWIELSALPPGEYPGQLINNADPTATMEFDMTKMYDAIIFIPRGEFELNEFVLPNFFAQ